MWDGLEVLIEVQRVDLQIAKLEAEAREIPVQIGHLEAQVREAKSVWDQARAAADQLLKQRRAKERDLEAIEFDLRKRQGRLFEVKTNQEYSAVLKEIETLREQKARTEEETLLLMEEQDRAAAEVTRQAERHQGREAEYRLKRSEGEAGLREVENQLAGLGKLRKGKAAAVDPAVLQMYTKLLKSRGGLAVVPVKEGSCTGCFVALTLQFHNEVRRNDHLLTCENCNRILYYRP